MGEDADIAIVGGGIAGVSLAAHLAGGAAVVLLEAEDQPGYHATGRSAAILAQNYGCAAVRALTAASEPFFRDPPPGFADRPLLSRRGLVRFAGPGRVDGLAATFREMSRDAELTWLDGPGVEARVPLLRRGRAVAGFANEAAADIDVHGLLGGYLRQARGRGAEIRTGAEIVAIGRDRGLWRLRTRRGDTLAARVLVDAAGAWADRVARMAGARPLALAALRRSAVTFDAPEAADLARMPMLVETGGSFYAKPEAGRIMASPADETPAPPGDARPEEIDVALCLDRVARHLDVGAPQPRATWAGLRTFAPDRVPVCGWDPDAPGFYWLAGQGGAGVQTAPALARRAADDILGRDGAARLAVAGLAPGALSPARLGAAADGERTPEGGTVS